ncbi:solute carrier family 46 member 3 [Brienomyrus brachyistius]|uniref:solute carrier family 46 member 3 n=1 Tax=Brienomyrus brachyistius TaxID=42636 RepID=UPI0020B3DE5F|nr:solute carrier family 46 member 3 [Brienomyrus brachyistius]
MQRLIERLREHITVEPVILLYMMSIFILNPSYQQLIITKVCQERYAGTEICRNQENYKEDKEIQERSSVILLIFTATLSLFSIPPAILLGSRSDRAGRKLGMLLPNALSLVGGGILITISKVEGVNIYWSLAASFVVGLSGGHVSILLSCFSYLADISDSSNRTIRMGIAESMIFIGGTLGGLLSGFLLQSYDFLAAFGAYCGCQILSALYVVLWLRNPKPPNTNVCLPEASSGAESNSDAQVRHSILMYAKRTFRAVMKKRPGQEKQKLYLLILCLFLNNTIAMGDQAILLLFLMYEPRDFTTELYGVFNSARMIISGIFLMCIFPWLLRCIGEMTLAKISIFFRGASYALLAFSTNAWMVFLVAVVGAPSGIPQAVIRSKCSAVVGPDEQGAMFSFSASVEASCILIGAVIFNGLYSLTLTSFPGMSFIVMAVFCFIMLIFLQWVSELPATQPHFISQD